MHARGRAVHNDPSGRIICNTITFRHGAAPSPSRPRTSGCNGVALDPAALRVGAAPGGRRADRSAVGRGYLGDGVMSAALAFNNVTLGYDRHPAVHHLNGPVNAGALMGVVGPNGAAKSSLLKGCGAALKPLSGGIDLHGLHARDIAYLPQIADIDRTFPIGVYDL